MLPYIGEWADGGAALSRRARCSAATARWRAMRDAAVAACQPFDYVLSPVSPVPAFAAEWASPTNDPQRPFEHIAFTLPYNMSEQPAASINCGYTPTACRSACRSPATGSTTSACCRWRARTSSAPCATALAVLFIPTLTSFAAPCGGAVGSGAAQHRLS